MSKQVSETVLLCPLISLLCGDYICESTCWVENCLEKNVRIPNLLKMLTRCLTSWGKVREIWGFVGGLQIWSPQLTPSPGLDLMKNLDIAKTRQYTGRLPSPLANLGGGGGGTPGTCAPHLGVQILSISSVLLTKQVSTLPVGYVPPCLLTVSQHALRREGVYHPSKYWAGGCRGGGVSAQGGVCPGCVADSPLWIQMTDRFQV